MADDGLSVEDHFGFSESPFSTSATAIILPHVLAATNAAVHAIAKGSPVILVQGPAGAGKTTAVTAVAKALLSKNSAVQSPSSSQLQAGNYDADVDVLIIDEAQTLPRDRLKLLLNARRAATLTTVLAAPGEALETLRPVVDHIIRLEGLSLRGAHIYLKEHLARAGGKPDIFTAQAVARLTQVAEGSVWRLRSLAGGALVSAMLANRKYVDAEDVGDAVGAEAALTTTPEAEEDNPPGSTKEVQRQAYLQEKSPVADTGRSRWRWPVVAIAVLAGFVAAGAIGLYPPAPRHGTGDGSVDVAGNVLSSGPNASMPTGSSSMVVIERDDAATIATREELTDDEALAAPTENTSAAPPGPEIEREAVTTIRRDIDPGAADVPLTIVDDQPDELNLPPVRLTILYQEENDASRSRAVALRSALSSGGWTVGSLRGVNFPITVPTLRHYQPEQAASIAQLRSWLPGQFKGDLARTTPVVVDFSNIAAAPEGTVELLVP